MRRRFNAEDARWLRERRRWGRDHAMPPIFTAYHPERKYAHDADDAPSGAVVVILFVLAFAAFMGWLGWAFGNAI
ncbi:MAG: hypothetical protein KGL39_55380 [Patescibacteria group bacterium]|nr:hypothetical protein [Patescibacteria group bacterium]